MSSNATAILIGRIQPIQIQKALQESGFATEPAGESREAVRIRVEAEGRDRVLWIMGSETAGTDFDHVHAGPKTVCFLGAAGAGPEIVRILAERFGGYHRRDDGGDDKFVAVAGNGTEMDMSPSDRLLFEFQRMLPNELARKLHDAVASNQAAFDDLRCALAEYAESGAVPEPSRPK